MRFHQLSLRGISEAFRERVNVDLESLGPGLLAIVGENGAGKSTLIGSIFAALFRQLPGQKRPLYDFCTHPEPEIDLTFSVNGERYRSLLKLDPKNRQMESYIFDNKGVALVSGKKEPFQEFIRKRVGTMEYFLASPYSSQKRTGNFLTLERSQRKELFITQLLGLDRLRLISATAKGLADETRKQVLTLEGERKGIAQAFEASSEMGDPAELSRQLEDLAERLRVRDAERSALEEQAKSLQGQEVERGAIEARGRDLERRIQRAEKDIAQLMAQIAADDRVIAERARANCFAEREREVATRIADLHRQIAEAQRTETSNREVEVILRTIEEDLRVKRDEIKRSRVETEELATVPCGGKGPYAGCMKIRRATEAREHRPVLEGAITTLELELDVQRASLLAVGVGSAELMKRLRECERTRQSLEAQRQRLEELRAVEARRAERLASVKRLNKEKATVEAQSRKLQEDLSRFVGLGTELEAMRRQLSGSNGATAQLRTEREKLIARRAQAEERLQRVEAARVRASVVDVELGEARVEHDDFDYLAKAFGPDEIQLCEIQSAGPGVSTLVNALLEGCFDNKFEVRFRTQRPKADGRGMTDDFDVEVRNKMLDRTCLVDELSGGQFVLVNEAVNLGIAIYNMQQGEGIRHETLFRDETVGALDAKNAKEYIRMLRHAMELGGFYQVIFICHQPQVWELADRILHVREGQVFPTSGDQERVPAC